MFNNLINLYFIVLDCIFNIFGMGKEATNIFSNIHFNDAPYPWQIGFQDPASPGFIGIFDLHDSIFFYLVLILFGVMWVLGAVIYIFNSTSNPMSSKYLVMVL